MDSSFHSFLFIASSVDRSARRALAHHGRQRWFVLSSGGYLGMSQGLHHCRSGFPWKGCAMKW